MVISSNRLSVLVLWNIPRWFFFQCFIIFEYIHSITLVSCPADLENLTQREMLVAVFCWSYLVMGRRVLAWFLRSRRTEMCMPFSLSLPPSTSSTIAFGFILFSLFSFSLTSLSVLSAKRVFQLSSLIRRVE